MSRQARPVTPDQRIRELRQEFKHLDAEEPGPDRAVRLAAFTRAAHEQRQLNLAMHTAVLCLQDDPDAPALLIDAYDLGDHGPEDRLRALGDLGDLARYVDRSDIADIAAEQMREAARTWVAAGDDGERRYRLRTVQTLMSREAADAIRDELRYQS